MPARAAAGCLILLGFLPFWVSLSVAFPFFPFLYLAAASAWIVWEATTGRMRLIPPAAVGLLLGWILLQAVRADVWDRSAEILLVWHLALCLGLLVRSISNRDGGFPAKVAILIWCLASFIAALNPVLRPPGEAIEAELAETKMDEAYKQAILHSALQERFSFPFGNPIHLGLFLSLSLLSFPFLYSMTGRQERPLLWRLALLTSGGVQLMILWGTRARTSLLALGVGAAVGFLLWKRLRLTTLIGLALGGILLLGAMLMTPAGREMASRVETIHARTLYWGAALRMIRETPLLGLGVGGFGSHYPAYRPLTPHQTEFPHQIFLETAVDLGAVGVLVFAAVLLGVGGAFFRKAWRGLTSHDPSLRAVSLWRVMTATAFLAACQVDFPNNRMYLLGVMAAILGASPFPVGKSEIPPGAIWKQWTSTGLIVLVALTLGCREVGQARFQQARSLLETERDFRGAYAGMTSAVNVWPPFWEAHYFRGRMASDSGDPKRGEASLREAIRWNPTTAFLREDLALLLWKQGRQDEAVDEIGRAIALHPVKWQYHRTLAGWLHELGQTEEAAHERELADRLRIVEPDYEGEVKKILEQRGGQ